MADRIQQALDGELPVSELSPEECNALQRYRTVIGTALRPVQQFGFVDVTPEVMDRIAPGRLRRALDALIRAVWAPRALSVRPVFGFAGSVAVAALLWHSASTVRHPAPPVPGRVLVQFRLGDLQAREVALVGDFNGWKPAHRLHRVADGVWAVDVALQPGVYNYVFMVDGGTLRLDPLAPRVTDGFGGASSRVSVLAPEPRS